MKRLGVAALWLLMICSPSLAIADDWAEVDISGYVRLSTYETIPVISTVYYFGNKGIGLQFGAGSSDYQEANVLTSWRIWTYKWGANKALFVHVIGRVVNEIGGTFDFKNGDVGFEIRPDFNIDNKITTAIRYLWKMENGNSSRGTIGFGVQFDIT